MKGKIITLILGVIAGIVKTIFLFLYLFKVKCPKCKKKKRVKEIIDFANDDKSEIVGKHCKDCKHEKKNDDWKADNIFGETKEKKKTNGNNGNKKTNKQTEL